MTLKSALNNEITNTESVITPRRLNFNQLSQIQTANFGLVSGDPPKVHLQHETANFSNGRDYDPNLTSNQSLKAAFSSQEKAGSIQYPWPAVQDKVYSFEKTREGELEENSSELLEMNEQLNRLLDSLTSKSQRVQEWFKVLIGGQFDKNELLNQIKVLRRSLRRIRTELMDYQQELLDRYSALLPTGLLEKIANQKVEKALKKEEEIRELLSSLKNKLLAMAKFNPVSSANRIKSSQISLSSQSQSSESQQFKPRVP